MIKIKKLIKKGILSEGILDGVTASFAIDAGISTSTVTSGRKSITLPRYSVWGFKSDGSTTPKLMENCSLLKSVLDRHDFTEADIYPIQGTIKETLATICESKLKGVKTKIDTKIVNQMQVLK